MSIDVDIMSTTLEIVRWGDVVTSFRRALDSTINEILGEHLVLRAQNSHETVNPTDHLSLNKSYYLELSIPNTLAISTAANAGNINEHDYLEDYGRNLPIIIQNNLVSRWHIAGHYYEISTTIGRGKFEPQLFVALASAVAQSCEGYVIIMNKSFDLDVGVYSPQDFRNALPLFGVNSERIFVPPPKYD